MTDVALDEANGSLVRRTAADREVLGHDPDAVVRALHCAVPTPPHA